MDERYVETVESLGVGSFPKPVSSLLDGLSWDDVGPDRLERIVERRLGLDRLPPYFGTIVRSRNWDDRLDRQLLGTICTFLCVERALDVEYEELGGASGEYFRFVVDRLPDGNAVSLVYPGYKNRFDYDLRVDNWYPNGATAQSPRHWHLFSDLFWKYKQARRIERDHDAADRLAAAVEALARGVNPKDALSSVDIGAFSVGRTIESLFSILPWFFIEEEINYPYENAAGKAMPLDVLQRLSSIEACEFTTVSNGNCRYAEFPPESHDEYHEIMGTLTNYEAKLQDNCEIARTAHAIETTCP